MLKTTDFAKLIENSELLGAYITQSEIAFNYKIAKKRLDEDREAQQLIDKFVKMKEKYEEVQRFGRYHPDFESVTAQIRKIKRQLDLHETVANFKKAEQDLEQLLNEVSRIIADAVSPYIKVPTGNPFFDNRRCQGNCGGGCTCQ